MIRAAMNSRFRSIVRLLTIGLAVTAGAPALNAQSASQDAEVPLIEPHYTRVFGSDTVEMIWPELSPDGRWIVFNTILGEATNSIWIVSVEGGEPIQLTTGNWDAGPQWFPTSDRIAFHSGAIDGVMTLPIDPETGGAAGPAQRVTLEPAVRGPLVSPNGHWIAYRVWATEGAEQGMALKLVPARGGNAREVMRLPGKHFLQSWSRDSKHIYFYWLASDTPGLQSKLMRVAVEGGTPEEVKEQPTGDGRPAIQYRIMETRKADATGGPLHEITTLDRRPLARVPLPRNAMVPNGVRFAPDGRRIVAVVSNAVAPLHVLPVAGGTARQLGDARAQDIPIGWTPEGDRVIFQTLLDGRVATMAAPVDGGAAREHAIIPQLHMGSYMSPVLVSEDGRYLAYTSRTPDSELQTLIIARAADGELREVTDSLLGISLFGCAGPGGLPTMGDEFLYLDRRGDRVELRATSFAGPSRLLRSLPQNVGTRSAMGVFESRVAWVEAVGDSAAVLMAEGPEAAPRRLAMVDGLFDDLVWSPDGRWIAASVYLNNVAGNSFRVMLIAMTPNGEVASPPRFIETQIGIGWGIRWLPDSRALTIFSAQTLPSGSTGVWLIPVQENEQPVAITRDVTAEFLYYQLSPDGRYIAYPAMIPRGSSLWLVDLGDALVSGGR